MSSFLQWEFLARLINLTRSIDLTWSDFRSSLAICWGWDYLPCLVAVGPGFLCPWSGSNTPLAICRHLLLSFFFAGNFGEGGNQEKTTQGFTSRGRSGQAVFRAESPSQSTGPSAKLSRSFPSVLLHISWRTLRDSFKLNWAFASKRATKVDWFSEVLKAYSFCSKKKGCMFFYRGGIACP